MWGEPGIDFDPGSLEQFSRACSLPISAAGALMPDAHVGYGLPIGGVLATRNCVIPYAVGVDIACRMKLTVLDLPASSLSDDAVRTRLQSAIERETRFGVGSEFKQPNEHAVMDQDWDVSPITRDNKARAWKQLGTSGSGKGHGSRSEPANASRMGTTRHCRESQLQQSGGRIFTTQQGQRRHCDLRSCWSVLL
jgi:tRNA-splicing ligase RtcB